MGQAVYTISDTFEFKWLKFLVSGKAILVTMIMLIVVPYLSYETLAKLTVVYFHECLP